MQSIFKQRTKYKSVNERVSNLPTKICSFHWNRHAIEFKIVNKVYLSVAENKTHVMSSTEGRNIQTCSNFLIL